MHLKYFLEGRGHGGFDHEELLEHELEKAYRRGLKHGSMMDEFDGRYDGRYNYRDDEDDDDEFGMRQGVRGTGPYSRVTRDGYRRRRGYRR